MSEINKELNNQNPQQDMVSEDAVKETATEVVENPADTASQTVAESASDISGTIESLPKKKKNKKLIGGIIAGAVALAVGGGVLAYNLSDTVKNKVKLMTSDPHEYFEWVVENNGEKISEKVQESYQKALDKQEDGYKSGLKLNYEPSNIVKELVTDQIANIDHSDEIKDVIDRIDSVSVGIDTEIEGTKQNDTASVYVNSDKVLSLDCAVDSSKLLAFARIPELTEKWIGVDASKEMEEAYQSGYYSGSTTAMAPQLIMDFAKDPSSFISPDELNTLINRYVTPLTILDDVDLEKSDEIDVGDISVSCSVIKLELDKEDMLELGKEYLEQLKDDDIIKEIVTEKLDIQAEISESDYEEAIDKLIDNVDEEIKNSSDKFSADIDIYVNSAGTICGFRLEESSDEVFFAFGRDGKKIAGEFKYTSGKNDIANIVFNAEKDSDDHFDGEIECAFGEYDNQKFTIKFDDFETVSEENGFFNADVEINIPEINSINIEFRGEDDSQTITYEAVIKDVNFGKITLEIQADDEVSVELPETDDAYMIGSDDSFDIEEYATMDDLKKLTSDTLKKIGFSADTSDNLTNQVFTIIEHMQQMNAYNEDDYNYDDMYYGDDYDYDDLYYGDDDFDEYDEDDYDEDDYDEYDDDDYEFDAEAYADLLKELEKVS